MRLNSKTYQKWHRKFTIFLPSKTPQTWAHLRHAMFYIPSSLWLTYHKRIPKKHNTKSFIIIHCFAAHKNTGLYLWLWLVHCVKFFLLWRGNSLWTNIFFFFAFIKSAVITTLFLYTTPHFEHKHISFYVGCTWTGFLFLLFALKSAAFRAIYMNKCN